MKSTREGRENRLTEERDYCFYYTEKGPLSNLSIADAVVKEGELIKESNDLLLTQFLSQDHRNEERRSTEEVTGTESYSTWQRQWLFQTAVLGSTTGTVIIILFISTVPIDEEAV